MARQSSNVLEVQYAKGFRCSAKVKPEVAFAAIEKLKAKNDGIATAESIVAAASGKRHPLHKQFNWDDTSAANEYRKEQARLLLRSIVVVYREAPKIPTRAYQVVVIESDEPDEKPRQVYRSTDAILADPATRAELLTRALSELVSFQRRFRGLQELAPIFRTVNEVLETVEVV